MKSSQVSYNKRLTQCICAIAWCLFSGGPIFGFAALKPILIKEHVYEQLCENTRGVATSPCTAQDLKLNMIFTVAAVLTNVSALAIGRVLDVYGPKVCGLIGAGFLYIASFTFIYSKNLQSLIDPYMFGYACLALGGPFVFISSFQLSNSFPKNSGTILALITGAFDASSAVFLIYSIIYNKLNDEFDLQTFFMVYLIVPTFITLSQLFIMPNDSYSIEGELEPLRRNSMGEAIRHYEETHVSETHKQDVFGVLHGRSAKQQILTNWFLLICLFTTVQMLRINYFVATVGTQYEYMFNSTIANTINKFFDLALPLGGIISVPFIGLFLDNFSSKHVLIGLVTISSLIGIFGLIKNYTLAIFGICLFVCYRPLFYTTISDICAKVFGFETFGTVYGLIICISGIINYGQSYLDLLTHTVFRMDPFPINLILLMVSSVIGVALILFVYRSKK